MESEPTHNRGRRVTVVPGTLLRAVVSDDVDEHVALLVLTALPVCNVRLQAEVEHRQILNVVLLRVKTTNHSETATLVNLGADLIELLTKVGKREVVPGDKIAIEAECYSRVVSRDRLACSSTQTLESFQSGFRLLAIMFGQDEAVLALISVLGACPSQGRVDGLGESRREPCRLG